MGSHAHAKAHVHLCHAALQLCVVDFEEERILAWDHFNHFLLYLRQLLGEVEIRGWALMLWCFSPPSDSTKQGGNPHVVPPSLPSANLSSAVWCGNAEIESLINILLFMVYGWRIYTLWYGPKTPLWCRSKIFFFFAVVHQGSSAAQIPIVWYHGAHLAFIKSSKWSEYPTLCLDLITWLLHNAHRKFMGHIYMPKPVQTCGVLVWMLSGSCPKCHLRETLERCSPYGSQLKRWSNPFL